MLMPPSTFRLAIPAPPLVIFRVEAEALLTSSVKLVADFCRVVVAEPKIMVPEAESNVRAPVPPDCRVTPAVPV